MILCAVEHWIRQPGRERRGSDEGDGHVKSTVRIRRSAVFLYTPASTGTSSSATSWAHKLPMHLKVVCARRVARMGAQTRARRANLEVAPTVIPPPPPPPQRRYLHGIARLQPRLQALYRLGYRQSCLQALFGGGYRLAT